MNAELQLLIAFLSLASALVGLYAGLKQVKASRAGAAPIHQPAAPRTDRRPSTEAAAASTVKWYDHPGWILFWLLAFWPVGILALVRTRLISSSWKKAVLWGLGALFVLAMLGG